MLRNSSLLQLPTCMVKERCAEPPMKMPNGSKLKLYTQFGGAKFCPTLASSRMCSVHVCAQLLAVVRGSNAHVGRLSREACCAFQPSARGILFTAAVVLSGLLQGEGGVRLAVVLSSLQPLPPFMLSRENCCVSCMQFCLFGAWGLCFPAFDLAVAKNHLAAPPRPSALQVRGGVD